VTAWCAAPAVAREHAEDRLCRLDTRIAFAFLASHIDYVEPSDTGVFDLPDQAKYLDKESGTIFGFRADASYMAPPSHHRLYAMIEYSRVAGNLDYTGHYIGSGLPVTSTSTARMTDLWGRIGKGIVASDRILLLPRLGLGYHTWDRGLDSDGTEHYWHKQWDVGGLVRIRCDDVFTVSLMLAIGRTFDAEFEYPTVGIPRTSLGSSPLAEAGLEIDAALSEHLHLFLGADYSTFRYGQSAIHAIGGGVYAMEPLSTTEITNGTLGLRLVW
jgi:hypothetical protein